MNDIVNDTVKTATPQKLLAAIKEHPAYTYEQYAALLGVSRATIARNIRKLSAQGCINRVGADKDGHWEISRCLS